MTDSEEKSGNPSTLEKALQKADVQKPADRKSKIDAKGQDNKDGANGDTANAAADTDAATDAPRRSFRGQIIGALSILLLLAIAYIAWPAWGPALPGWMQASLAPVMGAGRDTDTSATVTRLTARIEPLEKEISALKAEFAARPVADPARLLALDDLVKQNGERLAGLKTEIDTLGRKVANSSREDHVAALSQRLDAMETRLVSLAAPPASEPEPGTADASTLAAETREAIGALDALRTKSNERMAALERENVALRDMVAVLDGRLGAIEQKPTPDIGTTRRNALVLAVGQLREAVRGTEPFAVALQAVEALAGSEEALLKPIEALKPLAETGVPDLIALRIHFNRIAGRIAHESYVPKGEGWVDRTLGKVSRIFTFRRTGTTAAGKDDENGRVAQAELRLAAGDLAAAVTILEGLQGPARAYADPWLKDARARLVVESAIKTLFSEALAGTRASGDGKGASGG